MIKTNVGDMISRQAAIDAFHTWFRDGFDEDKWWNSTYVLAAIEGLPSVQQEHKWETCFDCPLSHGCPKIKGCTNEQAIEYASQIPNDCPLSAQSERHLTCKNCIHLGHAYMMPCKNCKRNQMLSDWYEVETERREE